MNAVMRNRLAGAALALVIYFVDQALKRFVTLTLGIDQLGDYREIVPFFDLRYTQNYGVSLGMFEANSAETRMLLLAGTALIALVVTIWMMREKAMGEILGLALILGGALGNIKDRYEFGYVIDYADLHFGTFRPFLIFNLADAAITFGVVIILARALFLGNKPDNDPSEPARAGAEKM